MKRECERLARAATNCRECFNLKEVRSARIDVAQPLWIGPKYWTRQFRVVVLMCNPGQGSRHAAWADQVRGLLHQFRKGQTSLRKVLDYQRNGMDWSRFYIEGLRLERDEVAFANVAWCATRDNIYPGTMLRRCFTQHTAPLLEALGPDAVLAAGGKAQAFARELSRLSAKPQVIPILHHAHRKSSVAEQRDLARARRALEKVRTRLSA